MTTSNAELEQFAYIASHDLQEPLRTVTSFLQLLERDCKEKVSDDGKKYIDFAVDGSMRMKQLIEGLLGVSRVGTSDQEMVATDTGEVLQAVINTMHESIEKSAAVIQYDELPTLHADETQLHQLFQNLIGNAIKYCDGTAPRIIVGAEQVDGVWQFSVADNGIGMLPKHYSRIFQIFQRLHGREEYSGVGIGLAICKKIVERHAGRIWVESTVGNGSTFYFTINESASARLSAVG